MIRAAWTITRVSRLPKGKSSRMHARMSFMMSGVPHLVLHCSMWGSFEWWRVKWILFNEYDTQTNLQPKFYSLFTNPLFTIDTKPWVQTCPSYGYPLCWQTPWPWWVGMIRSSLLAFGDGSSSITSEKNVAEIKTIVLNEPNIESELYNYDVPGATLWPIGSRSG